jgi:hypothetical protein
MSKRKPVLIVMVGEVDTVGRPDIVSGMQNEMPTKTLLSAVVSEAPVTRERSTPI